jgi:RNA polymerase sigma-70 factor (ECF subfamily)
MRDLALAAMAAPVDGSDDRSQVIEAARAGDLAAFDSLMRRHERLVLVTALRLLGSLTDAQDASQEVFLKLYRNLGKLERSGSISAWLYKVTVNVCHDARRRQRPWAAVEEAERLPATAADPQQSAGQAERRRALDLSLRLLSERERTAVVLRDLEGLSTEEVARVLCSSEATVRSQIRQGRMKMKGFLERYWGRRS